MILVTGATGLLGVHLLIELSVNEKKPIKAIYRTNKKKEEAKKVFLNYYPTTDAAKKWHQLFWVKADVTDVPSLEYAFDNITEVYHCAGLVSFESKNFNLLKKINIEGTANIVNLSLTNNISKLCHVSSISTLNLNPGEPIYNESSQWNNENDNSSYAISKFGGEMEVWRGIHEGLNAVIVNPGVILGSGFFKSGSGKIFNNTSKGLPFYTPGGTGYIGVSDCTQIMLALMNKNQFNDRFILVAKNTTHKKIIDTIAHRLGVSAPKKQIGKKWLTLLAKIQYVISNTLNYDASIPLEVVNSLYSVSKYDNSKIQKTLNWQFQNLETIINQVTKDYQLSLDRSSTTIPSSNTSSSI